MDVHDLQSKGNGLEKSFDEKKKIPADFILEKTTSLHNNTYSNNKNDTNITKKNSTPFIQHLNMPSNMLEMTNMLPANRKPKSTNTHNPSTIIIESSTGAKAIEEKRRGIPDMLRLFEKEYNDKSDNYINNSKEKEKENLVKFVEDCYDDDKYNKNDNDSSNINSGISNLMKKENCREKEEDFHIDDRQQGNNNIEQSSQTNLTNARQGKANDSIKAYFEEGIAKRGNVSGRNRKKTIINQDLDSVDSVYQEDQQRKEKFYLSNRLDIEKGEKQKRNENEKEEDKNRKKRKGKANDLPKISNDEKSTFGESKNGRQSLSHSQYPFHKTHHNNSSNISNNDSRNNNKSSSSNNNNSNNNNNRNNYSSTLQKFYKKPRSTLSGHIEIQQHMDSGSIRHQFSFSNQERDGEANNGSNTGWDSIGNVFRRLTSTSRSNGRGNGRRRAASFEEILDDDDDGFEDNPLVYYLRNIQFLYAIFLILNGFGMLMFMVRIFHSHLWLFQKPLFHHFGVILSPIWLADILALSLSLSWLIKLCKLKRFPAEVRKVMNVEARMGSISYDMNPMWLNIFSSLFQGFIILLMLVASEILLVSYLQYDFSSFGNCLIPLMIICGGGMISAILFKKYNCWSFLAYLYLFIFLSLVAIKTSVPNREEEEIGIVFTHKHQEDPFSQHNTQQSSDIWGFLKAILKSILYLPATIQKEIQQVPWNILIIPAWLLLIQGFSYIFYLQYHIYKTRRIEANARQQLILILYLITLFFLVLGFLVVTFPTFSHSIFPMKQVFDQNPCIHTNNDNNTSTLSSLATSLKHQPASQSSLQKLRIYSLDPLSWILFYTSLVVWFGASYLLMEEWSENLRESGGYVEPVNLNQTIQGWVPAEKFYYHYSLLGVVIFDKRAYNSNSNRRYSVLPRERFRN